jgi:hypothetical protein
MISKKKIIEKGPKGKSEFPWSLHMGIFRKISFINSPERRGKLLVGSIMERTTTMPNY